MGESNVGKNRDRKNSDRKNSNRKNSNRKNSDRKTSTRSNESGDGNHTKKTKSLRKISDSSENESIDLSNLSQEELDALYDSEEGIKNY